MPVLAQNGIYCDNQSSSGNFVCRCTCAADSAYNNECYNYQRM